VGVIHTGCEVPKKPVTMRVCGQPHNRRFGFCNRFATDLGQKSFATDEIVASGYAVIQ
jgi:hypothetical protein